MSIETGGTILVVDDEHAVSEVAKLLLSMMGWTVVVAENGKQALDLFQRGSFDLVLVDYSMPGMRGNELIATMRLRAPDQRAVLMSGFLDFDMPEDTGFLAKPFSLRELQMALATPDQPACAVC